MDRPARKVATGRIEAALYSAGRPLSFEELTRASGTDSRTFTMEAIESLIRKMRSSFVALEIAKLPDGTYVFQLRPDYVYAIRRFASKPLLSKATQRTLSYIAHEQPVSSKSLVEARGTAVYSHLRELRQQDFVRAESVGRLKIYNTTEKFQKYYGLPDGADSIRDLLAKKRKAGSGRARQHG